MARPIEPTPVLYGADAETLLATLAVNASPEEMRRRIALAKERTAQMMAPKVWVKPISRS